MLKMAPSSPEVRKAAQEFITFLNNSVTPYHAVYECKKLLTAAGFHELPETGKWELQPKSKYFVTKNRSAILAFAVGGAHKPGDGFSIVVGHTDSPCLRVKPVSKQGADRFNQVGVSIYGGGIWRTWFDRDLSVAGEIILRGNESGALRRKLVNVKKPILFIPNLAIHLETDRNTFSCNTETNLRPILESYAAAGLNCPPKKCEDNNADTLVDPRSVVNEHHSTFLKLISEAAECKPEDIVDMDLYLYDANPAAIGGVHEEFICGARLDNLVGTYTAIRGLIESLQDEIGFENERLIRMAACFDNEEVGSSSAMGAGTSFTEYVLRRIGTCLNSNDPKSYFEQAIGNSMLISADQAHAAHPNYSDKHEQNHRPCFHGGVVVKVNVNQRYATTPTTHAILKEVAAEAGVPLQKMIVRNDSPCGSTVGPILATALGLQTVDVGCPQLAMHSIREFADTSSIYFATKLYSTFHARLDAIMGKLVYSETTA